MENLKNKRRIKEKTSHFKGNDTILIDCATNKKSKDNNVKPRFNKKNSNHVNRRRVMDEFPLPNYEPCLACIIDVKFDKEYKTTLKKECMPDIGFDEKYKPTSKKECMPDGEFESTQGSKDGRKK